MGARGLRLPGDRGPELRRHLPLQLHEDRAAAGGAAGRGLPGHRRGRRGPRRPPRAGGALARGLRALRDRPGDEAPPSRRPRRHRPHPGRGGLDRSLRAGARAARAGDHGAVSTAPGASRDWDAATYDRVSGDVQLVWAREQLERVSLAGDEVVLDAGCGSGRVTGILADLVPRGRVYGVDAAPSMVEHARAALGDRARILCQDLVELELPEQVNLVFSNATFHWIKDHDRLYAALHRGLEPGGRLVAQCGGRGNIDAFRKLADEVAAEAPFAPHFSGWQRPWNYAGAEETTARLERAGFADVQCWLEPKRIVPADPRPFISTVCLVRHLDPLPADLHDQFVGRVLERAGDPLVLEYVRLNMAGRRG